MKTALALSTLLSLAVANCGHGLFPRDAHGSFGFNSDNGPISWYGLNKSKNYACALGTKQSPINITPGLRGLNTVWGSSINFTVEAYPNGAWLENLGTTLEVNANGTLDRDGTTYKLAQFHFHTPSEHRIESEYYPMEVHFVFNTTTGNRSNTKHGTNSIGH